MRNTLTHAERCLLGQRLDFPYLIPSVCMALVCFFAVSPMLLGSSRNHTSIKREESGITPSL